MRFSSRAFVPSFCVALLICGSGSPALSQTAGSLPSVTVDAPTVSLALK